MKKTAILTKKGLLYQLNQDIFGTFVISKPLTSRLNRILLSRFENFLRRRVLRSIRRHSAVLQHPTRGRKDRRLYSRLPLIPSRHLNPLNSIFFKLFFNYSVTKKIFNPQQNKLIVFWINSCLYRLRKRVPTILYHFNNRNYYASDKKPPKFKILRNRARNKVELLKAQHFYNFPNLRATAKYLKKFDYTLRSNSRFGISSSIMHLLFRTNIFMNSRVCYFLVKSGGISVNNFQIHNPYKLLKVHDHFSVNKNLVHYLFALLFFRVTRGLLANIPNFIDFDYKLMNFKLWRLPTKLENYFCYNFPFQRPRVVISKVLNTTKNKYRKN